MCRYLIIVLLLASGLTAFSQKSLQVIDSRFGRIKKHELYVRDVLQYKLKGERKLRSNRIAHLQDSLVVFDNETAVTLGRIKFIRIRKQNYHGRLFQTVFLYGAVGYPLLNVTNNTINNDRPLLQERAVIVSGCFLAATLLVRQLGIKRLHLNAHKTLRIVDMDVSNLNRKQQ